MRCPQPLPGMATASSSLIITEIQLQQTVHDSDVMLTQQSYDNCRQQQKVTVLKVSK